MTVVISEFWNEFLNSLGWNLASSIGHVSGAKASLHMTRISVLNWSPECVQKDRVYQQQLKSE